MFEGDKTNEAQCHTAEPQCFSAQMVLEKFFSSKLLWLKKASRSVILLDYCFEGNSAQGKQTR